MDNIDLSASYAAWNQQHNDVLNLVNQQVATPVPEQPTEEVKEKQQLKKPAEKKPKTKHSEPKKKEIEVDWKGRLSDAPIFHATLAVFGLDAHDINTTDRNEVGEIIRLVAEKLRTTNSEKILHFISRKSHEYPGENRHREFFRMLVLGQQPIKKKSPWK